MITETYKGRKIKVRKGREWGTVDATINGALAPTGGCGSDQAKAVEQIKAQIDWIDEKPVDGSRWGAEWYAPGTCTLCEHGHPVGLGRRCRHPYCQQEAPAEPFIRPVWVSVTSHRARQTLARIAGQTPEYGVWPEHGLHPRGEYHCVPGRHAQALEQVKGLRVLHGRPSGGRIFRRGF